MSARSQEIAAIERSLGRLKSMARDLMVERCAASMFATAAAAVAAYYCAYFAHGLVFSLSTAAACAALTLGLYSVMTSRGRRRMVTDSNLRAPVWQIATRVGTKRRAQGSTIWRKPR